MSTPKSGYGKFAGNPTIPAVDGFDSNHSEQKLPLGTVMKDVLGNSFKYVKANEAVSRGDIITNVARAAWDSGIAVDGAVTSGDTEIHIEEMG